MSVFFHNSKDLILIFNELCINSKISRQVKSYDIHKLFKIRFKY